MENVDKSKDQLLEELQRLQNRVDTLERLELENKPVVDSQVLLASILESCDDAIIGKTLEGSILSWNKGAEHLYGYSAEEVIGRSIAVLVPANKPDEIPQILEKIRRGERIQHYEAVRRRKDGQLLYVSLTISPIKDSVGQIVGASTIARDMTERKLFEEALQESERRFHLMANSAPVMIWIAGTDTLCYFLNKFWLDFTGRTLEQESGNGWAEGVHPADLDRCLATYLSAFEARSDFRMEYRLKRADGEYRWILDNGIPYYTPGNNFAGYIGSCIDITERKQMEEALQKTQAQLLQSQKLESVGRLAGGIAHDFNNLLTAITGYSELILLGLDEQDPLHTDITEIEKAANRAANLTRQLLAFSRQQVMQPRVLNLNEVMTDMDKLLHRLIGEDIELVSIPSSNLGQVWVDPGQIDQVIVNLAVNARDAMPDGGMLTIETANMELDEEYGSVGHLEVKTGPYVMLAITDTGSGMDAATQEKIFEPFFTTKEVGKGTGLGLATVYGIVNQSNGYIWVYSEPGVGTTFKIYLPRVRALPIAEGQNSASTPTAWAEASGPISLTASEKEQIRANNSTYTILVVEDESMVRELICRVLIGAGYKVIKAGDGQEAIGMLEQYSGQVDLVVTDIIMPRMGGRELIEQLKNRWATIKVICMSGYTDRVVVRHNILNKCNNFLQKPFTPRALLNALNQVLTVSAEKV